MDELPKSIQDETPLFIMFADGVILLNKNKCIRKQTWTLAKDIRKNKFKISRAVTKFLEFKYNNTAGGY